MKLESLVIANHHVAVNMYLNLAHTARHVPEIQLTLSRIIARLRLILGLN